MLQGDPPPREPSRRGISGHTFRGYFTHGDPPWWTSTGGILPRIYRYNKRTSARISFRWLTPPMDSISCTSRLTASGRAAEVRASRAFSMSGRSSSCKRRRICHRGYQYRGSHEKDPQEYSELSSVKNENVQLMGFFRFGRMATGRPTLSLILALSVAMASLSSISRVCESTMAV